MLQSGTYLFWRLECWTAAHKPSICSPFATFYTPNSHTEERAGLFQKSCVNVSLSLPLSGKHLLWVVSSACEMFYFGMASRRNHSPMWLKTFLISQHSWRPCMLVPCAIVEKSTRSIQSKSQCQCPWLIRTGRLQCSFHHHHYDRFKVATKTWPTIVFVRLQHTVRTRSLWATCSAWTWTWTGQCHKWLVKQQ